MPCKTGILTAICLITLFGACAQDPQRYAADIQTIQQFDRMYAPPVRPILFTGSSSIRKWDDLEYTFSREVALNRGFGGAVVNDVTYYANEIIFKYHPRQIILYVGENDLVEKGTTADSILVRFKRLYRLIREKLPDIPLAYISIKPSPSREQYQPVAIRANTLIREFLAGEQHTSFINIFPLMLDKNGRTRRELFVDDMLHMNAQGYAIWKKAVAPYLLKPEQR